MDDLFWRWGFRFDKFYDDKAVEREYYNYLSQRVSRLKGANKSRITQWKRSTIEKTIEEILTKPSDNNMKFDVKQENGVNILVLKKPLRQKPAIYRKIMALEDSYEIMSKAHRLTGHKGYMSVFAILKEEWSFSGDFINALNAVCNVCKIIRLIEIEKNEPKTENPTKSTFESSTWRLKLINLQVEIPYIEHPKYILVFKDELSKFLIIRALKDTCEEEVTKQLTEVFFKFGVPKKMSANDLNIKEVMDPALANIARLYPPFEVNIHNSDETTVISDKVILDTLKNWIEEAEVSEYEIDCEIGCHVVQRRLNTKLRLLPVKSDLTKKIDKYKAYVPHNLFLKQELSYEDVDFELMVLGEMTLPDIFHPTPMESLLKGKRSKRSLKEGKGSKTKKLKS